MPAPNPGRREIRSARSAARLEGDWEEWDVVVERGKGKACGWAEPRWPSFIAVVERAEREVVVELGVPLWCNGQL